MLELFKIPLICFFSFVVADSIWIGVVMKNFYIEQLRPIGRISGENKFEPVIWAALAVYVVLAIGVSQFVLPKVSSESSVLNVFLTGALMGLVIYGTYDFTNFSTLKDWTLAITFVDVAWGAFVTGLVSVVASRFV